MLARLPIEIYFFLTFISVMSSVKLYFYENVYVCVCLSEKDYDSCFIAYIV